MISEKEKKWIKEKLRNSNPYEQFRGYFKDGNKKESYDSFIEWEYELLEYSIQKDKPSDIKAYVEKKLKKKEYDKQLTRLERSIWNLDLSRKDKAPELKKKVEGLIHKADEEFPGFIEGRRRQISHIMGDLLALETDGEMGSMRMLQKLNAVKEAEEKKES
jgi:hypothetical protein